MNHIQFLNMCLRSQDSHPSSQCMEYSMLALHISSYAQDIKILNTFHSLAPTYYNHWKGLKLVKNCRRRYISLNDQCEKHNCDSGQDKVLPIQYNHIIKQISFSVSPTMN